MSGSAPRPLPEVAAGPVPAPGAPAELFPGVLRVTAPNPGIMTGPGTNTYLVGTGEVAVIDPGPDDPTHRRAILEAAAGRGRIRWVLVTHTHRDHAPGAAALAGETGAARIGFEARAGFEPTERAGEGWSLDIGAFRLEAWHTPGHASDHLCWLLASEGLLFSGDHVMQGSTVVIRPPDGDMTAYLASLERLRDAQPALRFIAPGHGRLIADPETAVSAVLEHRRDRERLVLRALETAGSARVDELMGTVYGDVDEERHPIARLSLWAHLRRLAVEGRVALETAPGESELDEGRWHVAPAALSSSRRRPPG